MEVRATNAIAARWFDSNRASQSQPVAKPAASAADTVSISAAARQLAAAQGASTATDLFDTDQGSRDLDIDAYFTPSPGKRALGDLPPLLLPSRNNIDALTDHISTVLPQFLAQNNIPSAPASITYDSHGEMQLPADYPYAEEFKQALADNPTLERELRTVNALTSHMVGMQRAMAFQQEYAAASQSQADAVVAEYSDLFSSNRKYDSIALQFTAQGALSLSVNGEPLS